MRLENRFEKEMNEVDSRKTNQMTKLKEQLEKKMADVQDRIVRLEQENEKLTGEFSAAKERIDSLEGEVERLSGLLLRPLATSNRRHPGHFLMKNAFQSVQFGEQFLIIMF